MKLFGDVLEGTTGVRETPENVAESPFGRACDDLIDGLCSPDRAIIEDLNPFIGHLPDTAILHANPIINLVTSTIQSDFERNACRFESAHVDAMRKFLPIGIEAVCILAFSMGAGKTPDLFESNRESVILAGSVMSKYPSQISANLKGMIIQNANLCMHGGDVTNEFRTMCTEVLLKGILGDEGERRKIQQLRSCPARKNIPKFCSLIFDMYATCYRDVWGRLADETGNIPQDKCDEISLRARLSAVTHLM